MNKKEIDSIAYLLKQIKENNKPKPIVFLGAGASASAGIPLTGKIISDILEKYEDKPEIKKLSEEDRKDYYKVMGSLETFERHDLLRTYIEDPEVKINVTHIYLAQMLQEGYIDYVVTVNFDDLLLKACALFNFIPAVYDIAILKDFTTTTLQKKSIIYLHGQYHGLWLLNTPEELNKVKEEGHDSVSNVFRQICNDRTWIVIGYSGEDGILDKIANLGRFDNNLFWVGYNDNEPSKNAQTKLLNRANSNTYWVSGYDADSFLLKLHSKLGIETPEIFNKPFSFLNTILNNIKDIEKQESHKELFDKVDERVSTSKRLIIDAIERYEKGANDDLLLNKTQISKDELAQEINEAMIKSQFDKAEELRDRAIAFAPDLDELIAELYFQWGLQESKKENYIDAIRNYQIAIDIKPLDIEALNNIGVVYSKMKEYDTAIGYFEKALAIEPHHLIYNNLGRAYAFKDERNKAIEYYHKAIDIKPDYHEAYLNASYSYFRLKENKKALEYSQKAISIKPDYYEAFFNIGIVYNNEKNYRKAIEYLKKAIEIKSDYYNAYRSLGLAYSEIGEYENAMNSYEKAIEIDPSLPRAYNGLGFTLIKAGLLEKAKNILEQGLNLKITNHAYAYEYMNLGHVLLCKGNEKESIEYYRKSLVALDDKTSFWNAMNEDFEYLKQYGITKKYYEGVLKKVTT